MARQKAIVPVTPKGNSLSTAAVIEGAIEVAGEVARGYLRVMAIREHGDTYVKMCNARREDARVLCDVLAAGRDTLDAESRRILVRGLVDVLVRGPGA